MARGTRIREKLTLLALAVAVLTGVVGPAAPVGAQEEGEPQRAVAEDVRLFDRYVGRFRSPTRLFDDGETEHYFVVDYHWYDPGKTLLKYEIEMVIPSQDRSLSTSEGFYGYDPVAQRLFVFGAFRQGAMGWGTMARFDHETGRREVWVESRTPDGEVSEIRDEFEMLDDDRWRNVTRQRLGGDGEWTVISEGIYTRLEG